jgi:ABC-type enterobactin transport system permease subunit
VLRLIWNGLRYGLASVFTPGEMHARFLAALEGVTHASTQSRILFSIRIPRMLLARAGRALSVSGLPLQVFSATHRRAL